VRMPTNELVRNVPRDLVEIECSALFRHLAVEHNL
jgi:hypothetical protein